jgi:hypothetical protein
MLGGVRTRKRCLRNDDPVDEARAARAAAS